MGVGPDPLGPDHVVESSKASDSEKPPLLVVVGGTAVAGCGAGWAAAMVLATAATMAVGLGFWRERGTVWPGTALTST